MTDVALTQLGDVSTVDKTLVEALYDVLRNFDATGSVDNSLVHAGGAQTLAKFFYDRNGHGRGVKPYLLMTSTTSANQAKLVDGIDNLFCSLLVPVGIAAGKYVAVHHDGRCHSSYSAVPIYHLFRSEEHTSELQSR